MGNFVISPLAIKDLFAIWRYIAEHGNIDTANRVEDQIYTTFDSLARTPGQGHKRTDLTRRPVLFFKVYSYMVVYSPGMPLEIVRVLHGRRNLQRLLSPGS